MWVALAICELALRAWRVDVAICVVLASNCHNEFFQLFVAIVGANVRTIHAGAVMYMPPEADPGICR